MKTVVTPWMHKQFGNMAAPEMARAPVKKGKQKVGPAVMQETPKK